MRDRIQTRRFDLVRVIELDATIQSDVFTIRIELLRSVATPGIYRARFTRDDYFRIQPTFPQRDGQPTRPPSDETVPVRWARFPSQSLEVIRAADLAAAEEIVLDEVASFLEGIGAAIR